MKEPDFIGKVLLITFSTFLAGSVYAIIVTGNIRINVAILPINAPPHAYSVIISSLLFFILFYQFNNKAFWIWCFFFGLYQGVDTFGFYLPDYKIEMVSIGGWISAVEIITLLSTSTYFVFFRYKFQLRYAIILLFYLTYRSVINISLLINVWYHYRSFFLTYLPNDEILVESLCALIIVLCVAKPKYCIPKPSDISQPSQEITISTDAGTVQNTITNQTVKADVLILIANVLRNSVE